VVGRKGYDASRFQTEMDYARISTVQEWLRDNGYNPDEIFEIGNVPSGAPYLRPVDQRTMSIWLKKHVVESRDRKFLEATDEAIRSQVIWLYG
jgi:peptidoglycan hydrolase-like protein with peptidoglycan-binding domain